MWPDFASATEPSSDYFDEMRVTDRPKHSAGLVVNARTPSLSDVRYGDTKRLLKITAFVQRFLRNTRRHGKTVTGPLSTDEYEAAEILWFAKCSKTVVKSPQF